MPGIKKIPDKQFFAILRENSGLYSRTAKAIKAEFDIDISRQAVRTRALSRPDILLDIDEQNIDIAEEGLYTLMKSKDERIRLRAIEIYLKTKGKTRGYTERQELQMSGDNIQINVHKAGS